VKECYDKWNRVGSRPTKRVSSIRGMSFTTNIGNEALALTIPKWLLPFPLQTAARPGEFFPIKKSAAGAKNLITVRTARRIKNRAFSFERIAEAGSHFADLHKSTRPGERYKASSRELDAKSLVLCVESFQPEERRYSSY